VTSDEQPVRAEVRMPNLGYDMEQGKVVSWLKEIGDHVARGEPLAEIETDKTTVEMEATVSGVLAQIVCPEGSEAAVGAVIAYLEIPA
jgi:pyruvate dehydrogenase E2 component (dihydrolipoamide acetyltransferase)